MWTLTIVLYTTIGIFHPVILTGKPDYMIEETCIKAGEQVKQWLTQDCMEVAYSCTQVEEKEEEHENR